jgi:hypothetical protein
MEQQTQQPERRQYIKRTIKSNIKTINKSTKKKEDKTKEQYIKPSFIICFDE